MELQRWFENQLSISTGAFYEKADFGGYSVEASKSYAMFQGLRFIGRGLMLMAAALYLGLRLLADTKKENN